MSRAAIVCAASLLLCAGGALAQQPKMFPGTSFPGHDLYSVPTASPEDCANRCLAEQRCKAFTWSIPERRCQLKWDSSTFDGSLTHVSGIIEGRQASPPPATAAPRQARARFPTPAPAPAARSPVRRDSRRDVRRPPLAQVVHAPQTRNASALRNDWFRGPPG